MCQRFLGPFFLDSYVWKFFLCLSDSVGTRAGRGFIRCWQGQLKPSTSTLYASIGFKFHVTATEQLEQYIIPGIVGRPACPLAGARAAPERTAMQHKKPFHGRDPPLSARCAAAQTPGGLMSPGFKFCSNFTLAADPPSRSSHPCVRDVLSKLAMA